MKKVLMLATAALLVSGVSFAQDKKCGKKCCKKGSTYCKDKEKDKIAQKGKTVKI